MLLKGSSVARFRKNSLALAVAVAALVSQTSWASGSTAPAAVRVFFVADDGVHGRELWRSDGTKVGTYMVLDLREGDLGSNPVLFAVIRGQVFFGARDGRHGNALWVSDGSASGTRRVPGAPRPYTLNGGYNAVAGGSLYFVNKGGLRLWRTDGTRAGTYALDVTGVCLASAGRTVFFTHNGTEVWRTDGTPDGTFMVQRVRRRPSATGLCIRPVDVGRSVVYGSRDVRHGWELWRSNGTFEGTYPVLDIVPGPGSSYAWTLDGAKGIAFFSAIQDLWVSDGTAAGTNKLQNFRYVTSLGGSPMLGRRIFFHAPRGGFGAELWVSDGTRDGTSMVKDINPGHASSNPIGAAALDGLMYFGANDGEHEYELWATDGTEPGTHMVADINPGALGSFPDHLVASGDALFFGANDGVHGYELWTSDGTEAGTAMLKDVNPGAEIGNVAITYLCASPNSGDCQELR
jgi:ELWxxDGT repeat protein